MKNGTRFSPVSEQDRSEDAAADPRRVPPAEDLPRPTAPPPAFGAWGLAALSVALAGAAVATGVQAVRLARFRVAARALTDVDELLRACQERITQMERDLRPSPPPR